MAATGPVFFFSPFAVPELSGCTQMIEVVTSAQPAERKRDQRRIWDVIAERMKAVPLEVFDRLPKDGASEHDHYLYGSPKRNQ